LIERQRVKSAPQLRRQPLLREDVVGRDLRVA
jgi:hypothetical protein